MGNGLVEQRKRLSLVVERVNGGLQQTAVGFDPGCAFTEQGFGIAAIPLQDDVTRAFRRSLLVLVGLAFCGVGWLGLTQPKTLMDPIGVPLTDLRTLNELEG